jgi:glycosyltransferase involved in cell wall biosynthesis
MKYNSKAIALFEKARALYCEKRFDSAKNLIKEYRQAVRYDDVLREDRRPPKGVTTSIIIVSFGTGEGLKECLDSLSSQEDDSFEIILVDNGGNEGVESELKDYPLLHLRPPINLFPSEGRNLGAYFANGEFLAFIDDDARVHPGYVKVLRRAWECCDILAIRGKVLPKTPSSNHAFTGHYNLGNYPIPAVLMTEGNMVIKKDVFRKVGGFDPLLFGAEGTELTYRCQKKFPERDIYYWPTLIIYHDFAKGRNLAAKKQRHALASNYFDFMDPEINRLATEYGRWYQQRPGKTILYDRRSFLSKFIALTQEKWIALNNRFRSGDLGASSPPRPDPMPQHTSPPSYSDKKTPTVKGCFEKKNIYHYKAIAQTLQEQLDATRSSIAFRLGNAIAEAFVSPVKKGFRLPFEFYTLLKEHRNRQTKNRRGKRKQHVSGANLRNNKKYLQPGIEEHLYTEFDAFKPFKSSKNSVLSIACILGTHMEACLDFEANLISLDPERWQQQLEKKPPDMLLVQSAWDFSTTGWKDVIFIEGDHGNKLNSILRFCCNNGIPTVFWDTEYHGHFPLFYPAASLFDYIFATDSKSVERYQSSLGKERCTHLPLAVQPALHNPVRPDTLRSKKRDYSILFDGWADLLERPQSYKFLGELLDEGLHIVESRYRFVANKLNDLPLYRENTMGNMAYDQLLSALRSYRVYLMSDNSLSSRLSLAQRAMEAVACGATVVYKGACNEFIPQGLVFYADSDQETIELCKQHLKEELGETIHGLKARRKLFANQTYAQRLQTICNFLGIDHTWEEFPRVSLITPTKRPDMIPRALANYQSQKYPNKEWIIILNSAREDIPEIKQLCQKHPDISCIHVHEEKNIGACLNLAIQKASGEFCFKIDDDDFYGPNYVLDMMLEMRAVDADIFGKPTGFIYLEGSDKLMMRHRALESQYVFGGKNVPHMCGANIAGKRAILSEIMFAEDMRACVDTDFLRLCKAAELSIYLSNIHGFAAMRGKDKTSHTWRAGDDFFKKNSTYIGSKKAIKRILI